MTRLGFYNTKEMVFEVLPKIDYDVIENYLNYKDYINKMLNQY